MTKKEIKPLAVYTIKEAAPLLGVHWQVLADKVTAGEIQTKMYGNRHLILGQNLINFLQNIQPK